MLLKDKVAFITGGSQGIGKACAMVLAEAGANVAVGARTLPKLQEVVRDIEATQRRALAVPLDVSDSAQIKVAFATVFAEFGRIDILVNNAGMTRDMLLLRMTKEDWDSVLHTNLTGTFQCTQEAIKIMVKQRYGRIVNISSVIGLTGNAGQANYAASKAGIIGLSKSVAQEVASRNITVNVVAPGYIETAMTSILPEVIKGKMIERTPCGRAGSDRDVAFAVKFLASDEAAFITGQVLNVNGGLYM